MNDVQSNENPENSQNAESAVDQAGTQNTPPTTADGQGAQTASSAAPTNNNSNQSPREQFVDEVNKRRDSLDDHEPEETLWSGGYSPKAMVGSWIGMVILTVILFAAVAFIEPFTLAMAAIVAGVLWVLVAGSYAAKRLGYHYELTSQRFIHKTGILTRRTDRIEVIDIDDVSYEQGPIQRMFGVGTIQITSSDRSDPHLALNGIDKVSEVAGLIDDIRRAERRRRSLHIESI